MPRRKYHHFIDLWNDPGGVELMADYLHRIARQSVMTTMWLMRDGPVSVTEISYRHPMRKMSSGYPRILGRNLEECEELGLATTVLIKDKKYYYPVEENLYSILLAACSILERKEESLLAAISSFRAELSRY